jgi:uncharacterized protein (TIGR02270 family)
MSAIAALPHLHHIPDIIVRHVEDAAFLWSCRCTATGQPNFALRFLDRFDQRLEAHLDGLRTAAPGDWHYCRKAAASPGRGAFFTAATRAVEDHDEPHLDELYAIAEAAPERAAEMFAAHGWAEPERLRQVVRTQLASPHALRRLTGVAACGMHRVDPGLIAGRLLEDPDAAVRARAWRTAGEIGKRELVSTAAAAIMDEDPPCQFWAAWSAVLLGDKHNALDVLATIAAVPGPFRARAFQLMLQAKGAQSAHGWLATLAKGPEANLRWLIRGAGLVGDPTYVPWLIGHMADEKTTRPAGEAFSLIAGLDLAWLDLEVKPPENFESGPNDDPNDPNVDMDEDDGLPWPDAVKIQAWWHSNSNRFQPGTRYFMGEPLNRDNCLRVLKEGFQRQRIAAALYLSLLNPGTPLFEWRAPARRQQRLLAEMK